MKERIKNEKGFTLVELLAVIVILGLLMAIAIPSVTKYITQSRIKTLVTTMDSYITAVVTQVNDGEYKFSDSTKIFAIPIECIPLEKGGTDPFGNWMQANSSYWAYVLVHYDSDNYNYEYGFTFKDDAGYGLYPTKIDSIENNMVKTGYDDLEQPKNGGAYDFVPSDKWEGFSNITSSTELVVLEATSEDGEGNGETTCTLCKKGDNYEEVEIEKIELKKLYTIVKNNGNIYSGLGADDYKNNVYFYANSSTNNVLFANFCWKIVRTTDTGGVKLIYNGTPTNNQCNGDEPFIGQSKYSENWQVPAYLGYMYNKVYSTSNKYMSSATINYKFSNSFTYKNGSYSLNNPITISNWKNDYSKIISKQYTCFNSTGVCNTLYYVYVINNWNPYYISLSNGESIEDALNNMLFADDVNKYDSPIKGIIDNWFANNMSKYSSFLEDTIFCNDRRIISYGTWNNSANNDSYIRFYSYKNSDLSCPNKNDQFTVNSSNGNGKLTYPIGLLTKGEADLMNRNDLALGNSYYLGSPAFWGSAGDPGISMIYNDGDVGFSGTFFSNGVRPVVSLKTGIMISSGTGISSDPYVVQTN